MKSKWKLLTLVGTFLAAASQAGHAQGPRLESAQQATPASSDFFSSRVDDREGDRYSLRVGELDPASSAPATSGNHPNGSANRPAAVSSRRQSDPTDATRYVLQLDDRQAKPAGASGIPATERASSNGIASTAPVMNPAAQAPQKAPLFPEPMLESMSETEAFSEGPLTRFSSMSRSMLSSAGDSLIEGIQGKGGKSYCNCPACSRGELFRRTFASVEFSHMWTKSRSVPPLVTTDNPATPINSGPPLFTPIALTLNSPTEQVLLGNEPIGGDRQAAGKVDLGWWLDSCRTQAIGFSAYGNEGAASLFNFVSNGSTPLGRPFENSDPFVDAQDALIVAHPLLRRSGSVGVRNGNEFLGGEVYYRSLLDSNHAYRIELLAGYRFNRIDDDLMIDTVIRDQFQNQFFFLDLFDVNNTYNAGDLGLYGEFERGPFTLSLLGKIGAGNMNQRVAIRGFNSINNAASTPGGLLTQPTNIGVYERDVLVWSPEANIRLAYALTNHLSLSVGYTFMYWTAVAMAGDQIDTTVNATQLTGGTLIGSPDPQFRFHNTDYWVQSVDVGFTWNY